MVKEVCYVVHGTTGEYSDRSEWQVAVYTNREQADWHAAKLNELVAKFARDGDATYEERDAFRTEYDPRCNIDYTGVRYGVVALPLCCHVDEFLEHHSTL